jgi:hypothetical protein
MGINDVVFSLWLETNCALSLNEESWLAVTAARNQGIWMNKKKPALQTRGYYPLVTATLKRGGGLKQKPGIKVNSRLLYNLLFNTRATINSMVVVKQEIQLHVPYWDCRGELML